MQPAGSSPAHKRSTLYFKDPHHLKVAFATFHAAFTKARWHIGVTLSRGGCPSYVEWML